MAVSLFGPRLGISIDEAATLAGVSRDTIYAWIREGRLAVTKIGKRTIVLLPSLLQLMADNVTTSLTEIAANKRRRERKTPEQPPAWTPADIGTATDASTRPRVKRTAFRPGAGPPTASAPARSVAIK